MFEFFYFKCIIEILIFKGINRFHIYLEYNARLEALYKYRLNLDEGLGLSE